MKNYDISVIIPEFNHEQYLDDLLDSIKTDLNIEVIIVDDYSPNESNININEIIKKYNNLNIKLIKNEENLGLFSARRVGVNNSDADLIFICDADDMLQNHLLDNLYYQLTTCDTDICKANIRVNDKYNIPACESPNNIISNIEGKRLFKYGKFSRFICGTLIKKELLFKVYGLFKEYFYLTFDEDILYNMMILKFECKITWLDDKYYYKRDGTGISTKRITDSQNIYVKKQMSVNIMEILKRYNLLNS